MIYRVNMFTEYISIAGLAGGVRQVWRIGVSGFVHLAGEYLGYSLRSAHV